MPRPFGGAAVLLKNAFQGRLKNRFGHAGMPFCRRKPFFQTAYRPISVKMADFGNFD
jgi:hypothetical protein